MFKQFYTNPFADGNTLCYAAIDEDYTEPGGHDSSILKLPTAAVQQQSQSPQPSEPSTPTQSSRVVKSLQRQLRDVTESKQEMEVAFNTHLAALRKQLDRATEENNDVLAAQTRQESVNRGLTLEKENLEWTLQQERNRVAQLNQHILQLEEEFRKTQTWTRDVISERHSHDSKKDEGRVLTKVEPLSTEAADTLRNTEPLGAKASSHSPRQSTSSAKFSAPTAATPPVKIKDQSKGPACNTDERKGKVSNNKAQENVVDVAELEARLLYHNQRKGHLESALQRLESARLRTAADRAKREAAERDLEEEKQLIGKIRMQLRCRASTKK